MAKYHSDFAEDARDFFYPLATMAELAKRRAMPVQLFGVPLVLYTSGDGAACLINKCAHRGSQLCYAESRLLAPLVRKETGTISCPYHNWEYESSGQCVYIPDDPSGRLAKAVRVQSFKTKIHQGFVWVSLSTKESPLFRPFSFEKWDGPLMSKSYEGCRVYHQKLTYRTDIDECVRINLDPSHVNKLHRRVSFFDWISQGRAKQLPMEDLSDTEAGYLMAKGSVSKVVDISFAFCAPFTVLFENRFNTPGLRWMRNLVVFYHVPVDETTTQMKVVNFTNTPGWMWHFIQRIQRKSIEQHMAVAIACRKNRALHTRSFLTDVDFLNKHYSRISARRTAELWPKPEGSTDSNAQKDQDPSWDLGPHGRLRGAR